jgi:sugar phosphate isomerase/epimerase
MKLAIQHSLLPGDTLTEKFQRAADFGFAGVEVVAWGFSVPMWEVAAEIEQAMTTSGIPVSSLCTMRNDDFVHPELAEREKRLQGMVKLLQLAQALGATGIVGLPIRQPLTLPDLSPVADEHGLITQLAIAQLKSAIAQTPDCTTSVFLEPLNRYESRYLKTIAHAAQLCEDSGSPRVQIMADMFHMSIEEVHIADAMTAVIQHIGHVHLADSNRLLPGHGHTDFIAPFAVLQRANFGGWLALECGVPGNPAETLPASAQFLQTCWQRAAE